MNIRPVSDLRNHFSDIEKDISEKGPVFLQKMDMDQWLGRNLSHRMFAMVGLWLLHPCTHP